MSQQRTHQRVSTYVHNSQKKSLRIFNNDQPIQPNERHINIDLSAKSKRLISLPCVWAIRQYKQHTSKAKTLLQCSSKILTSKLHKKPSQKGKDPPSDLCFQEAHTGSTGYQFTPNLKLLYEHIQFNTSTLTLPVYYPTYLPCFSLFCRNSSSRSLSRFSSTSSEAFHNFDSI